MTEDVNGDGQINNEDVYAEQRRQDHEDMRRATQALGASVGRALMGVWGAIAHALRLPILAVTTLDRMRFRIWLLNRPGVISDTLVWRRNRVWELATKRTITVEEMGELMHHTMDAMRAKPPVDYRADIFGGRKVVVPAEYEKVAGLAELNRKPTARTFDRETISLSAVDDVEPAAMMAPQAFAGIPGTPSLGGAIWAKVAMGAAVAAVVLFGFWQSERAKVHDARADARIAQQEALDAATRNAGLTDALKDAGDAMAKDRAVMADYENRIAARQRADASLAVQQAAMRRREQERLNAVRNGGTVSDADLLRELAEPASVGGDPVPPDPAAAAPAGVLGQVHGAPDADPARADPGAQR